MLLAPILSELSELSDQRWLTLIAPPVNLTSAWFRDVNINRERVLILQNNTDDSTVQQVTNTLQIGRSHTVVSWLTNLDKKVRKQLETAANQGETQSLNISLRS
ncbi:UNVERIFIED_CONTAM: hypothetical protein GTU68_033942 [Idotea baltica]|nr:hypothetical protein [Idotea baltica]